MFKQNESSIDRMVRIMLGAVLFWAGFSLTGIIQTLVFVIAVVFLFTGISGFCALYALFGMSTKKEKK